MRAMSRTTPTVRHEIDTQSGLESLLRSAATCDRYAIDTEFHRERTYYPDLALIQMCFTDASGTTHLALIDPKPIDLAPFAALFATDTTALVHAPAQDFEIFEYAVGALPTVFFDTQIAAGFAGFSNPSLARLVQHLVGVSLSKGDRMTDWNRRPLTPAQQRYALADVEHLALITDTIFKQILARGRLGWAEACFAELIAARRPPVAPTEAWRSISEIRSLHGEHKGAAIDLAAWRENLARKRNIPVRKVMSDIVLVCVAGRLPSADADLDDVRGFQRHRGVDVQGILAAVATGRTRQLPPTPPRLPSADPRAVALATAWVADHSHRLEIDRTLLATREDIELRLAGLPSRLDVPWRAELIGNTLDKIASGDTALALDPDGGYRLIEIAPSRPASQV